MIIYFLILFIFLLLPVLSFFVSKLFNLFNIILKYCLLFLLIFLFILIQSLSIKHNYFESLNEVLFIYLWWYFIFSTYGLYKREHELRLLEPIKFSFSLSYFYKFIKRSIKIRYYVLKELFLSFNLRDFIIIGLIFIMSYVCLRILRAWLIYEIINIYGLDVLASKYLTVWLAVGYEVLSGLKLISKPVMNLCKSNLLEGLRTIYLGIQNIALGEEMYDYIYIKKLQEKIKTEKTSLDKLRYKTLKMKSAKKLLPGVIPVIKGNEPHIKVVLSPGTEAKIVEVQEIVISTPKAILNEDELKKMTPKKLKDSGLYSASRVPLFNFYSGFPLYKASKFGNYVCIFENSGMYTDTVEGFIPFNYLNVSVLKEYLSIADVKKQHVFLHENRFEIQQAHKYQKLYEQYLQCIKKGKNMNDGPYTIYNRYKNDAKVTNYFEIIEEFKHSLNTKLSPHITSMFNYNFLLNDQQILYEMSMFMSLLEHIDPKKFTVYILETKFKLNEHDIRIKNNETKEEISLQLKALTSTNQYLINEINKNIAKYKKDTNILCVSSSIGNIIEVLDGEKKVITPVHSIFNLTKKFDSTRIFVPECADVTKALAQQQQVLAFKKNVHNELTNNITIHRDTTGVSNESCIKPSSIKKSKIK